MITGVVPAVPSLVCTILLKPYIVYFRMVVHQQRSNLMLPMVSITTACYSTLFLSHVAAK
jgi:hypothetical protein